MNRSTLSRSCIGCGLALLILAGCADSPNPANLDVDAPDFSVWDKKADKDLRVLTWNTYLGGDTGPLFTLDFTDPTQIPAVLAAVNTFWAAVDASDFPARAAAIVDEIEDKRPHIVSLQEVVQFAVFDLTIGQVVGGADMLATIQAHLAARGLPYELVATQTNTDSQLPMALDFTTFQPLKVLAFKDRVAMLRRTDVQITDLDQGTYAADFNLGPLTLKRGYIRASFAFNGEPYHVVNTHLETQGLAHIQAGQVDELLNVVMAGLDGVTVLNGDLNSDAEADADAPSWTPTYQRLIDSGFEDAWEQSKSRKKTIGYTCCQDPDLRNGASLLDERIDFMLVRAPDGRSMRSKKGGSIHMEILGEEQDDRVGADGLWPADHAGLAAILRIKAKSGKSGKSGKSNKG